ncbi:site-2 protease family protein [Neoroseomonas oryzicola]|uniref:Site-2 protease family protein n=1 Tax=Neoroseomonas oryzicola TaxID=535904 RepID=A0A9X9WH60_9PROT|nr:site-2 protease family protein [Neoroseomonas oryzicola]MBR0659670.1 site-2 protease family protein [Neoroseomonas oryzicola]NKE15469.1 site-2 protease family protein [Neoroseomonas oryzicola]
MLDWLPEAAAAVLAAVLAITMHEAAHGYAALALGDDTAKKAGRISLNPLRHVDTFGTLILPGLMIAGQLLTIGQVQAVFGWAKPVPVDIWRLRNPRWGMVLVAAAGPAVNAFQAIVAALLVHAVVAGEGMLGPDLARYLVRFLALVMVANLVLGLFNLLPLPPLDGGRIMVGILPRGPAIALARVEPYGLLIVILGLFILPMVVPAWDPMNWFVRNLVGPAFDLVLVLTGHGAGG